MLARLAVHYLTAEPEREGVLIRERTGSFAEPTGISEPLPEVTSDEDVLAWVQRHWQKRLAEVGGNRELLRRRRADAVWLDITDPEHPQVEVNEIKVARKDVVAELRRPEKSAVWAQQAHRFWLTVPDPGLIDGLLLPPEWGVLALPYGSHPVILRRAPALTPREPVRRDLLTYARRHAQPRWRFDGERFRPIAGRYTVASRLRPGPSQIGNELGNGQ